MQDAKRQILQKVASGSITAEEAALELESLDSGSQPAPPPPPPAAATSDIARVRVRTAMGSITVIGDESVLEAVADGPHSAHRDGDAIVIEGDENSTGFVFSGGRFGFTRQVTVRMNPRLPLEADLQAGSLRVQGIRGPIKAEVQAGSTRIEGFTEPVDLDVQAGSVRVSGRLTDGKSRIRCQAGKVNVDLDPASSVRISARTSMGRISLPGTPSFTGIGDGSATAVVGSGAATLDLSSEMGSIQVEVGK
jgi:hypothetical protein